MATSKRPKVVQTVFRDGARSTVPAPHHNTPVKEKPAKVVAARAARKAAAPPKKAALPRRHTGIRVAIDMATPHVIEADKDKPLIERLNDVLLAQLRERKITNKAAAEALGVSEFYLSRTVARLQPKKPGDTPKQRQARSKLFKARTDTRATLAKQVNKGELTLAQACKRANCSERTMYRWCEKYANLKK